MPDPSGSCLVCGKESPYVIWQAPHEGPPTTALAGVCATCRDAVRSGAQVREETLKALVDIEDRLRCWCELPFAARGLHLLQCPWKERDLVRAMIASIPA